MNQKVFRNVQVETIIKEENIMIEDIKKGGYQKKDKFHFNPDDFP